jgi:type IV fimbrial biogenesis protein FimT
MRRKHEPAIQGRQSGFSLIEQIVVSCVLLILVCMAAPALGHLLGRNQLQAAQSDILISLQHARGLAVDTGRHAMLCPSRDGTHCSDELHWEGGWLIGHYQSEHTDQIEGAPNLTSGARNQLTILSTIGRRRIRFQADGSAGGSNVSFTLCRQGRADGALAVTVANSGRIYGSKATGEQADRCAAGG